MKQVHEVHFITELFGKYDGSSLQSYLEAGGFKPLQQLLAGGSEKILKEIDESGLQGRGGAAYPTGRKLRQFLSEKAPRKFVVCNADEGEPGTFKDRELLRRNIYQVIEGMIITAVCTQAGEGIIYVREEYTNIHDHIEQAIESCYQHNYLGKNILGSGFSFELRLFSGAGSYVCGEGFAMCESMEGKSGRPRTKPPYVKQAGFLNLPTLVINTETLSAIVSIIRHGAHEFRKYGTAESPGTKLISVSGKVERPGVYEIPFGLTINEIVNGLAGGMKNGKKGNFVQIGGASGGILPARLWDTKYTYEDFSRAGMSVGSGAIVVADTETKLLDYLKVVQDFFNHESCGKCTPCREGNRQLRIIFDKIAAGTATAEDFYRMEIVLDVMGSTSLCGSGKTEVVPFNTAIKYFPEEFAVFAEFEKRAVI